MKKVWISRRKWKKLEKRVADLEVRVQSQQVNITPLHQMKAALGGVLQSDVHQSQLFEHPAVFLR